MVDGVRLVAICAGLTALAFLQDSGRTVLDTSLVTMAEPLQGLRRLLSSGAAGQEWAVLTGPAFLVMESVGLPLWAAQRLAWAGLLTAGFLGAERVSGTLGITSPGARITGALAFSLSPPAVLGLGVSTAHLVPYFLAPWIILFLARAGQGRMSARRAAALSGLVTLLAGVGDRAVVLAAVAAGWWWVACGPRPDRRGRLAGWWAVASTLAIGWWAVPALTGVAVPHEASFVWVAWRGVAPLPGPSDVCVAAVVIAGAVGVATAVPRLRILLGALLTVGVMLGVGLVAADQWHVGGGGALLLIALPCALGLAGLCARLVPTLGVPRGRAVYALAIAIVMGAVLPLATSGLVRERSIAGPPPGWAEALAWIDRSGQVGRAIVLPAAAWADSEWTRITGQLSPWDNDPSAAWVAAVGERVSDRAGWPGLADYLAHQGVAYLIVPRGSTAAEQAQAETVREGLSVTPGFVRANVIGADDVAGPILEIWEVQQRPVSSQARAWISDATSLVVVEGGEGSVVDAGAVGVASGVPILAAPTDVVGVSEYNPPLGAVIRDRFRPSRGAATPIDRGPIIVMREPESRTVSARIRAVTAADYRLSLGVRPRAGDALEALLMPASDDSPRAHASSVFSQAPAYRPQSAIDGELSTAWLAGEGERNPELVIEWSGSAEVSGVMFLRDSELSASRPLTVTVTIGGTSTTGVVGDGGELAFPPRTGEALSLRFDNLLEERVMDPDTGRSSVLPLGISEVAVRGLEGRTPGPSLTTAVRFPEADVPQTILDGTGVRMCAQASVAHILRQTVIVATPCDDSPQKLTSGAHEILAMASDVLVPDFVAFERSTTAPTQDVVHVDSWRADERVLVVQPDARVRLLETSDSVTPSWSARLDGAKLQSVTVAGWRQAWVIPAGAGGVVSISAAGEPLSVVALPALLLGALALVMMWCVVPGRASSADTSPASPEPRS